MDKQRIVITGVGVVAPNGIGKEEFWKNCLAGVSGIKHITLFDTSSYRCHVAGEISNFQPEKYLGPKGLRNLDRATTLLLVSAQEAIEDAKLEITGELSNCIGVVVGTTLGSINSISTFDRDGLLDGPRYVNPGLFPNTVMNSSASQVAIRFGLRGLNSTIATGFTAGFDALRYAMDMLSVGRAKKLIVGCVEELCIETYLGFNKLGVLANTPQGKTRDEASPNNLYQDQDGLILGEGSVVFVLEGMEDAVSRRAKIYGEVRASSSIFTRSSKDGDYDPNGQGLIIAMKDVLRQSGLSPRDISYISVAANSTKVVDVIEATAVRKVFGNTVFRIPINCIKAFIGETISVSVFMQLAVSLRVLKEDQIPFTSRQFRLCDRQKSLNKTISVEEFSEAPVRNVMVNGLSPRGVSGSLIISSGRQG